MQVKVLYVRNLMLSTSELQILDAFSAYGVVERVKKIKDYAFVHFQSREEAHAAMGAMNGELALWWGSGHSGNHPFLLITAALSCFCRHLQVRCWMEPR